MSTVTGPGAAQAVRDHCLAPSRDAEATGEGRYGRLWEDLPALTEGEHLFQRHGREAVADDRSPFVDAEDDDDGAGCDAAGWPFFAQFVAHDLTADRSVLASRADVAALVNARGARLNLECVYGRGPGEQPYLYRRDAPAELLLGLVDPDEPDDVPRNREGLPLLGDQRNDVHVPISQLHVAFLHAHNGIAARLRGDGVAEDDLFAAAQRVLRWHYQWIVLHDFLPRAVGPSAPPPCGTGARSTTRAPAPGSPWSSPTPPTATGTRRSASATSSTAPWPRSGCSPTSSGCAPSRRRPSSSGTCSSTCRAARRPPSARGAWTGASSLP
jgi:hypothetical protein